MPKIIKIISHEFSSPEKSVFTLDFVAAVRAVLEAVAHLVLPHAEPVVAPPHALGLALAAVAVGEPGQRAHARIALRLVAALVLAPDVPLPVPGLAAVLVVQAAAGGLVRAVLALRRAVAHQPQRQAHPVGAAPLRLAQLVPGAGGGRQVGAGVVAPLALRDAVPVGALDVLLAVAGLAA